MKRTEFFKELKDITNDDLLIIFKASYDLPSFKQLLANEDLIKKMDQQGKLLPLAMKDTERAKLFLEKYPNLPNKNTLKLIQHYVENELNYTKINFIPKT